MGYQKITRLQLQFSSVIVVRRMSDGVVLARQAGSDRIPFQIRLNMKMPADYHMHTPLCMHAKGEPTEYAAQAVELGLTEIGLSDHSPMKIDGFDDWRMLLSDLEDYVARVERARNEHPSLTIRLALEVDYLPGHEAWIRELADMYPWDYFIGSVHYVYDTWDLDNPTKISQWKMHDPFTVWTDYFGRLTMAAASGLFDIIGHADLCKKFCYVPEQDCQPLYLKFLRAAKSTDTAIEINTSGAYKDCKEFYPSRELLSQARSEGVALTFGSDAHDPKEVGRDFETAVALARGMGFENWRQFSRRQKTEIPL